MSVESLAPAPHFAARLGAGALVTLLVSGPLFLLFPQIDTGISNLFFKPGSGFVGNNVNVEALRNVFKLIYVLSCAAAIAGVFYTHSGRTSKFLGFTLLQHIFLISCLAIGPGLLTNVTFKDHWGRARPREIVQFGGSKTFTPAFVPARQCKTNCSFVSGEASSIFMIFFAGAMLLPRWSAILTLWGIAGGMAAGAIRIAQGGHFISDVVVAGVLMALTAAVLQQFFKTLAPDLERSP